MVNNRYRITGQLIHEQVVKLAGMFPKSEGPIMILAGGGVDGTDQMKKLMVVGKTGMGVMCTPELIR